MDLPDPITTARLRLFLVTPADAAAMAAGRHDATRWHPDYPRRDDVDAAVFVRDGNTWGPRHIVFDRQAVGSIGCFGPPVDGEVEVGYGLVAPLRGRGIATEALLGLAAACDALGVRMRASVAPHNTASVRVLAKAGFRDLRGTSEDGELIMARPCAT